MNYFFYGRNQKNIVWNVYLVFLIINFFEIFGLGLMPIYILAISSYDNFTTYIPKQLNFLLSYDYFSVIIISSFFLVFFFIVKNFLTVIFYQYEKKIFSKITSINALIIFNYYIEKSFLYHQEKNPAEIIKNICNANSQASDSFRSKILLIKEVTLVITTFIILLFINFKLTFYIVIFLFSFSILFYFIYKKKLIKIGTEALQNQEEQLKILNHSFHGIREVKIFGIQNYMKNIFDRETTVLQSKVFQQGFYNKLPRILFEVVSIFFVVLIILYLLKDGKSFRESLPLITLYAVTLIRFIPSFSQINSYLKSINFYKAAESIVYPIINNSSRNLDIKNKEIKTTGIQNDNSPLILNLKNIFFFYPSNNKKVILKNFNLKIYSGDRVCIFGESGQGKSTIVDLIMGLLQPQQGQILINNKNIKDLSNCWFNIIGYVPQKVFLFDDTLLKNLTFQEKLDLKTKKKLENLLVETNLYNFVNSLPKGLNTKVGNMGSKLSGGQIQRFGIIRALMRDPKIIILDESTNSLDNKAEDEILAIFKKEKYKNKIIIFITHNKRSLRFYNRVITLKNKKVHLNLKKDEFRNF